MDQPPQIPDRFSALRSLIPRSHQHNITMVTKRAVSARTAISQLSTTSTASDFIDAKMESIKAELAENSQIRGTFDGFLKRKELTDDQFNDAMKFLENDTYGKEQELILLKRQKKAVMDDIDESIPRYDTVQEAYTSILMTRIMAASSKQQKRKKFDQSAFSKAVCSFYGASRVVSDSGAGERYCHLTGWQPEVYVKCAHLVPKSLESDELSYLFGVREAILSEPRNGITLNIVVKEGLDSGRIELIPDKPIKGEGTVWRCVLADQTHANDVINSTERWRDLEGKELQFLTPNRPARRYLHLRYVITVLHQKKLNNVAWLDRLESRGYLWATPGPYLRNSMLHALAKQVSDHFLPEVFYDSTFAIADGCPQRSAEDEEDLAMALDHKMLDHERQKAQDKKDRDEDESEEEDSD